MNHFKRLGEGWVAVHALVSSLYLLPRWLSGQGRQRLPVMARSFFSYASLLVCGLLFGLAPCAWSAPFLIVGTPEAPFKMKTTQGIQGIDVEIIAEVMNQLDVPYEIQLISSGARIIREAEQGRIDMVLSFSYKAPRTAYLDYPLQSYKAVSWSFFYHVENTGRFQYQQLTDLKGAVIGAVNQWAYTPEFWNSGLTINVVSKNSSLVDMLLHKHIDLAPMNTQATQYLLAQRGLQHSIQFLPKPLVSRPYFNTVVRASTHSMKAKVLSEYDRVIENLKAQGFIDRVYQHYLESNQSLESKP